MAAYERHSYSGTAADTTLSAGIDDVTLTVTCADLTGWPDGSGGDFFVIFEPGKTGEEKCLAASRSGNTLTLRTRGVEGSAGSHAATTTTVRHGYSARDADEANYAVSQTVGKVAAKGDLLYGSAANTFAVLSKGSAGQVPVWQTDGTLAAGVPTLAESDITDLETDLAAKQDAPDSGWDLGSILVGKADGTADTVTAGVTGTVPTVQDDGSLAFATPTSGLLDVADHSASITPTGVSTFAALDSTNLTLTFTAPASGQVLLRFTTTAESSVSSSRSVDVGWITHGTTTQVGRTSTLHCTDNGVAMPFSVEQLLTGLTSGTSYHLDLASKNSTLATGTITNSTLSVWAA